MIKRTTVALWIACVLALLGGGAQAQYRVDELGFDVLPYVDFESATEETVKACRRKHREWVVPIRSAYRAWKDQHGKAQAEELRLIASQQPARAPGDPDPVLLLQLDLRNAFKNQLAAMDKEALGKFCAKYAQLFNSDAMNFTERLSRAEYQAESNARKSQ